MQLTKFARDCRLDIAAPILKTDSEAALKIGHNPLHPGRRQRHWRTRADLLQQACRRKLVLYEKVDTSDNISDILSKPCGGEYFESMAREICGAEPLTLPGTTIDIRHKGRIVKEARKARKKAENEKQKQQEKSGAQIGEHQDESELHMRQ